MSEGFTVDAAELKAFVRRMRHMGDRQFATDIRGVHRRHAKELAKKIKVALPKTGSRGGKGSRALIAAANRRSGWKKSVAGKQGSAHDTRRGAMSQSIRTVVTTASSVILGGGTAKSPHYAVQEFGGAVWWRPRSGPRGGRVRMHPVPAKRLHRSWESQRARHGQNKGHIITVRDRIRVGRYGAAESWFFYPAVYREEPALIGAYNQELHDLIQRNLPKLRVGGH